MNSLEMLEDNLIELKKLRNKYLGRKSDTLDRIDLLIDFVGAQIINHPDYLEVYSERRRKTFKKSIKGIIQAIKNKVIKIIQKIKQWHFFTLFRTKSR
jgi:hypothetical protein